LKYLKIKSYIDMTFDQFLLARKLIKSYALPFRLRYY
jgi:hypothetical protein